MTLSAPAPTAQTPAVTGANFIGGQWVPAGSGGTFERRNPADDTDLIGTFPASDTADVERAVAGLLAGAGEWANTPPTRRAEILEGAADWLAGHREQLVTEMVREEGKTRAEAAMEVGRAPANLRYFAGEAMRTTGQTYPGTGPGFIYTLREPVGIVGAITPWNFPLNIASRKVGPALAAGDPVLFKPSEVTPLLGQRLVESLLAAGLPTSAIALVQGDGVAGAAVVAQDEVAAVTFTGSTAVGRAIHQAVGPTRRVQLELGGKNAAVVLDDADLDRAVRMIVTGAFGLSGQACTGTSRVIATPGVYDELLDRVAARAADLVVGPGINPDTQMGPLASAAQLRKVLDYIDIGCGEGARLVVGGQRVQEASYRAGYFVQPAVFADVTASMRIFAEEIFGPVLAFTRAADPQEALDLANATEYGLSGAVFTNDIAAATAFIRGSKTGLVKVNQPTTGMAMNAPFGGYRASSTQTLKEQGGPSMMAFYQSEKTIYLDPAVAP